MVVRRRWLVLLLLSFCMVPFVAVAADRPDPRAQMDAVDRQVVALRQALATGDAAQAKALYPGFEQSWFELEDAVRSSSQTAYAAIEQALGDLKYELKQEPVRLPQAIQAADLLHTSIVQYVAGTATAKSTTSDKGRPSSLAALLTQLDAAQQTALAGDSAAALTALTAFRSSWPTVEAVIAAKNLDAYRHAEDVMISAAGLLKSGKAIEGAAAIEELAGTLRPYVATTSYTVFDAASILLREGLEALLVIAALLAFLQKSGNADKRRWVWVGGLLGISVSVATALALYWIFRSFMVSGRREVIEGVTGLVAAAMLFYVSYWLHSKTQIGGWQTYLKDRTNAAIARGSLFSLAFLSFLSVFREGAETALFYIGIAPAISFSNLLLGLSIGIILLAGIGILIIGLGVRIPLGLFFQVASLLIWYLGFKFIGTGLHALQVARIVSSNPLRLVPAIPGLGLYQTWETTAAQLSLLAIAVVVVFLMRSSKVSDSRQRQAHA
ncbi:MAG: FTR1 family iron permease [Herpetosiphon sp.]